MPEAEVTLRLAMFLIQSLHTEKDVVCAIDGAQIKVKEKVIFPIREFLSHHGWDQNNDDARWRGVYRHSAFLPKIVVHSSSGEGDLVAELRSGKTLRVESKKGPLTRNTASSEYPLIREAIGQLMTVERADIDDILAVAVPESEKFLSLACEWRNRPLLRQVGIHIITVNRHNMITGFDDSAV